jgi:hypothetical protein
MRSVNSLQFIFNEVPSDGAELAAIGTRFANESGGIAGWN